VRLEPRRAVERSVAGRGPLALLGDGRRAQRREEAVPLVVRAEVVAQGSARGLLERRIDRGRDREAAAGAALGLDLEEELPRELHRLGREIALDLARGGEAHGLALRRLVLGLVDEVLRAHLLEDEAPALEGLRQIALRVVGLGRGRDAGEHGGLGDRQLAPGLAEAVLGGLLDPVAPVAEVDVVQVELEDLVLAPIATLAVGAALRAELLLEAPREERLAHLPPVGALVRLEQDVLHDLLRDRRAALARASCAEVHHGRARDAEVVDALVLVEARVFGGDERRRHVAREIVDLHDGAPLGEDLGDGRAVAREHARDLRRAIAPLELRDAREVGLVVADEEPAGEGAGHAEEDRGDREPERPLLQAAEEAPRSGRMGRLGHRRAGPPPGLLRGDTEDRVGVGEIGGLLVAHARLNARGPRAHPPIRGRPRRSVDHGGQSSTGARIAHTALPMRMDRPRPPLPRWPNGRRRALSTWMAAPRSALASATLAGTTLVVAACAGAPSAQAPAEVDPPSEPERVPDPPPRYPRAARGVDVPLPPEEDAGEAQLKIRCEGNEPYVCTLEDGSFRCSSTPCLPSCERVGCLEGEACVWCGGEFRCVAIQGSSCGPLSERRDAAAP
jgi:hypothetical protein